jgi:hypothetical protein
MRFRLAAPSCVIPDRVGPNCRRLSSLVGEVGLMLLETRGCLDYDERDLPGDLSALGLSYHAHLPLDLPWAEGPGAVADAICALEQKIAFLCPRGYVLHPPAPVSFQACWRKGLTLLPGSGWKTRPSAT